MDTLKELTKRLEKLEFTHDPVEMKTLLDWIEQGGLKSLESGIAQYINGLEAAKSFTLPVRTFDSWEERNYEVFPYTTVNELKTIIEKDFGLKEFKLRFVGEFTSIDEEHTTFAIEWEGMTALGEIMKDVDSSTTFKVHILPPYENPHNWEKKPVMMPVRIENPTTKESKTLTFPITETTTIKELGREVTKIANAVCVRFSSPEGTEITIPFDDRHSVWTAWWNAHLFTVTIF